MASTTASATRSTGRDPNAFGVVTPNSLFMFSCIPSPSMNPGQTAEAPTPQAWSCALILKARVNPTRPYLVAVYGSWYEMAMRPDIDATLTT
jgi:hypothetical protein